MKQIQKKLSGLKALWEKSKAEAKASGPRIEVPDGRYIAQLTNAEQRTSQAGNQGVNFEFTILDGEFSGTTVYKWHTLENEDNLVWLQRDMLRMGVDLDEVDPEDLQSALDALVEAQIGLRIRVRNKDQYINVLIERVVDDAVLQEIATQGGEAAEAPVAPKAQPKTKPPAQAPAKTAPAKPGKVAPPPPPVEEAEIELTPMDTEAIVAGVPAAIVDDESNLVLGTVKRVFAKKAQVLFIAQDGSEFPNIDFENLFNVPQPPEGATEDATGDESPTDGFKAGMRVMVNAGDGETLKATVVNIEADGGVVVHLDGDPEDSEAVCDPAELSLLTDEGEGEGEGEGVTLEIGMAVKATIKGKQLSGKVVGVDEDEGLVTVQVVEKGLKRSFKVSLDDIEV